MNSGAAPALPRVFARSRRRLWLELAALATARASATAGSVLLVRELFDALASDQGRALAPLGVLALCLVLDTCAQGWERAAAERLGQHYVGQTRSLLFAHLAQVELRELERRGQGALLLRMVGDLTPLRQWIASGIVRMGVASAVTGAALAALGWSAPALALAVGVVFALGTVATLALASRLERRSSALRRARGALANRLSERLHSPGLLRVLGIDKSERRALERAQSELQALAVERARSIGALRAIAAGAASAALLATLALGTLWAPRLPSADLAAAVALVGLLAPGLRDLGKAHEIWVEARVVRARLQQLLALPRLPRGATPLPASARSGPLAVSFEAVGVAEALKGVDLELAPGRRIALLDGSSPGARALLELLARAVQPDVGCVRVGGVDLATLARRDFRQRVGVASPRWPLLRGALERNLRCRWRTASRASLARAIERCELEPLLTRLPKGARTRLLERGANLSPSDRTRVRVARAVLGEPGLLLLDELDTDLDQPTREWLRRLIEHYPGTVLFTTRDEQFVRLADEAWRVAEGRIQRLDPTSFGALLPCS